MSRDSLRLKRRPVHVLWAGEMNEWITWDAWGEGYYRGCGFGPSVGCMGPMPALADTIEAALVRAYQNNPQLNSQRAQVRSTDENVPQALSGYRPKVAVTASAGYQYTEPVSTAGGTANQLVQTEIHGANAPRSVGATITQNVFNGQQTANKTRAAESQVSGAREGLRVLEQTVLLSRRHHLHGLSARLRDRRGSEEQRPRARADAEADAGTGSMSAK